jgi:hypothetical protein
VFARTAIINFLEQKRKISTHKLSQCQNKNTYGYTGRKKKKLHNCNSENKMFYWRTVVRNSDKLNFILTEVQYRSHKSTPGRGEGGGKCERKGRPLAKGKVLRVNWRIILKWKLENMV